MPKMIMCYLFTVSTHSRPKAAGAIIIDLMYEQKVSTHSRPKAAGCLVVWVLLDMISFNTQPPEGGWYYPMLPNPQDTFVSTHSRPKAAGQALGSGVLQGDVSTHSRPKAAGCRQF